MLIDFIQKGNLKALQKLATEKKIIAIDTEFMQTNTYYGMLSLVQIYCGEGSVFVIDMLSKDIDFEPLKEILLNKEIIKVFHSCYQDCEVLQFFFGCVPQNIIDTQVLGGIIGIGKQVGYSSLVRDYINIEIDKANQFSKWLIRPLSENQIKYAALDVYYLLDVYYKMFETIENNKPKIINLLKTCHSFSDIDYLARGEEKSWRKFRGKYLLNKPDASNNELSLGRQLINITIHIAKRSNRIPRMILDYDQIVNIIEKRPIEVYYLPKLSKYITDADKKIIIDVVRKYSTWKKILRHSED